jgi:hypothetical protein
LQTTVEERFKTFRQKAVALMDELDALRKRHKTLPATDPDFKVPMEGATEALYTEVNRDLDVLWERWLSVMEIWDQAQKRIRAGSGLALQPTEEARKLLEGNEIDELAKQATSCKERLDWLNHAHEQAREDLAAVRAELAAIHGSVSEGTGVLLPSDPHHREIEAAETALADAELMLTADPLGALERVRRARATLESLTKHPSHDLARPWGGPGSYHLIDELIAAAERLRQAAARLGVTGIIGLFIKVWIAVWVIGLLFGMLIPLLVPIIMLAGFVIMFAGGIAVFRAMTSWLWFGLGGGPPR